MYVAVYMNVLLSRKYLVEMNMHMYVDDGSSLFRTVSYAAHHCLSISVGLHNNEVSG